MAALQVLEIKASDALNIYVTTPSHEKIWTVLGLEFGCNAGKSAVIARALYGLKSILHNVCGNQGIPLAM